MSRNIWQHVLIWCRETHNIRPSCQKMAIKTFIHISVNWTFSLSGVSQVTYSSTSIIPPQFLITSNTTMRPCKCDTLRVDQKVIHWCFRRSQRTDERIPDRGVPGNTHLPRFAMFAFLPRALLNLSYIIDSIPRHPIFPIYLYRMIAPRTGIILGQETVSRWHF